MEPVTLLSWATVVLEAGYLGASLLALGQRIQAGETVTWEELDAAREQNIASHNRIVAAGQHDRPDKEI